MGIKTNIMRIKADRDIYVLARAGQKYAKQRNAQEWEQHFKDFSNNTITGKVIKGGKITAIGGASLWTGDKIVDLIKEPQVNEEDLVKPIIKYRHKAVESIAPQVIPEPSSNNYGLTIGGATIAGLGALALHKYFKKKK